MNTPTSKKEGRKETIRIKIYSVKGNFNGKLYGHVDVPCGLLTEEFWRIILSGKKVPNSKL